MNTMNNILSKIFLLLVLALGWGGSAWAVTTITPSPAPTNGQFAANTQWYTIVYRGSSLAGTYLNVDQNTNSELTWGSNTLDKGAYWCFVGDNTSGFKMYNLKSGATMVLQAVSDADNAHVKMVAATTANENLSLFTTGAMTASGKTNYNYIRRGTSGNAGFNNNSNYVAMYKHPSNLTAGANFAVEITAVTLPDNGSYRVVIQNDNNYTVTTTATASIGSQSAKNGGSLELPENLDLKDLRSFTIDCTDKFVWGPVIDKIDQTVTFTIKEPVAAVANLSDGFYQLQLAETKNNNGGTVDFKASLGNILNTSTVNVKSNYYYVMPWFSHNSYNAGDQSYKYSGVYASGNAPASFVYLSRDASGNLRFQSIRGHYNSRPDESKRDVLNIGSSSYKIEGNKFSIDGWTKQGYWGSTNTSGDEGPHEAFGGGKYHESYYLAEADISSYNVYKVEIDNWKQGSNLKGDPTVTYNGTTATNYGLPTVYRNGYFFFPKEYIPVVSDFTVSDVTFNNLALEVEGTDDIKTLHFKEGSEPWFTIKNHRKANGYLSVANAGLEANQQMKWGVSAGNSAAEYWQMKADGNNGFYLINKAYGEDYVLGIEGRSNGNRVRMYHISEANSENTHFDKVESTKNTCPGEFCIMLHSNRGIALHDYSNQLGVWSHNESGHKGDEGSAFVFTQVESSTIEALPSYTAYRIDVAGNSGNVTYDTANQVIGQNPVAHNYYMVLNNAASLDASHFTVSTISGSVEVEKVETEGQPKILRFTESMVQMGDHVTVRIVDPQSAPVEGVHIFYIKPDKSRLELTAEGTYDLHEYGFAASRFVGFKDYVVQNATYDATAQTLTFTVVQDKNKLFFSEEPGASGWGADTHWFMIRSNRHNNGDSYNKRYLSTTQNAVRDDFTMYVSNMGTDVKPADRGGYWCFVGSKEDGFRIQNAAYGPDFYFVRRSDGKYLMMHKSEVPSNATQLFTYNDCAVTAITDNTLKNELSGKDVSTIYQFIIGTSGDNHIIVNNNDLNSWDAAGKISNDCGSSFFIEQAELPSPAYDVYKVEGYDTVTYFGNREKFGKRNKAPYLILAEGTEITKEELSIPGNREIDGIEISLVPNSSYIKLLKINLTKYYLSDAGWYQMTITPNGGGSSNYVVYNSDSEKYGSYNGYPLSVAATAALRNEYSDANYKRDARQWVYVRCDASTGKWTMQALDGHYLNEQMQAQNTSSTFDFVYRVKPDAEGSKHYVGPAVGVDVANGSLYLGPGESNRQAQFHPVVLSDQQHGAAKSIYVEPTATTRGQRVAPEETTAYDIWKVATISGSWTISGDVSADTRVSCINSNNVGLASVYKDGYFVFPAGTQVNASDFTVGGYHTSATVPDGVYARLEGVTMNNPTGNDNTYTRESDGVTVRTQLNADAKTITITITSNMAKRPIMPRTSFYVDRASQEQNHIVGRNDGWRVVNDRKVQNTNHFNNVMYVKPGATRRVMMPTAPTGNNWHPNTKITGFQHWYNLADGGAIPSGLTSGIGNANSPGGTLLGSSALGLSGLVGRYYSFIMPTTGTQNYTIVNETSRWTDGAKTFIAGETYGGVKRSDPNGNIADGSICFLEPTLSQRQMYEFHSAHEIANKLLKYKKDGERQYTLKTENGKQKKYVDDKLVEDTELKLDWLEGCIEIVMPTKSTKITSEVLPLDMQVFNYWCYDGSGTGDDNLVNADRQPLSGDQGGKALMIVRFTDKNGNIVDSKGNPTQTEAGDVVTDVRTGITLGQTSTINHSGFTAGAGERSHGIYYDLMTDTNQASRTGRPRFIEFEYPGNDRIVNSEHKDTYISVFLKPDNSETLYQIKQFHLLFQDDTELLPKSQVEGLPAANNRSPEFKKTLTKATELSFPYDNSPYIDAYGVSKGNTVSQFPLKYEEINYGYYHNNNDQVQGNGTYGDLAWSEYGLFNKITLSGTTYTTANDYGKGYFIYADAAELPGSLATLSMDGQMCTNNVLYCSMYITNAMGDYGSYNGTWTSGTNAKGDTPASILIRIYGVDSHGNRTNIYNYCPGVVGKGSWRQMAFNFAPYSLLLADGSTAAEHPFSTFEFEIVNNCRSSWGGDYAIDNLQIFVGKPKVSPERIAPLCGHELDVVLIRTNFDDVLKASDLVSEEVECSSEEMAGESATKKGKPVYGVYCFVDSDKYWEALQEYSGDKTKVHERVNYAFNKALVGERKTGSTAPAYHIIRFSTCYSDHDKYDYGLLANPETNPVPIALREYVPAKENSPAVRDLVFNAKIHEHNSEVDTKLQAGREYFLVFQPIERTQISSLGASPENDKVLEYANANLDGYAFGLDYATPEALELGCPVLKRFKIKPAYRLVVDGEEQSNIIEQPFCQGAAPTINVTNTIYTAGGDVQDNDDVLYYDWYSGSLENYYRQVPTEVEAGQIGLVGNADPNNEKFKINPGADERQFCLDEVLLVFRSHFPEAIDLEGRKADGTSYANLPLTAESPVRQDANMENYTLAMQKFLQMYVETPGGDLSITPRLRLHRKQVQLNLDEVRNNEVAALVAVPTARREGFQRFDNKELTLSCYDPQEVSFMPKHAAPTSVIGHGELDKRYSNLLNSIPIRLTKTQAEAISSGHKFQIPLRQLKSSGYYDSVKFFDDASSAPAAPSLESDGKHRLPMSKKNNLQKLLDNLLSKLSKDKLHKDKKFEYVENPVKFEVNALKSDLFISETNDPQWQKNVINDEGDAFLPCVGSLVEISAATAADRSEKDNYVMIQFNTIDRDAQTVNKAEVPDADGVTYTFKTDANGRYCYPDKGLTVSGSGSEAKNVEHKAYREFIPREGYYYILKGYFHEKLDESAEGEVLERANDVSCDGTIIIPIKVVPEYMKWTGAVNSDWSNDRNWARADRSDLVTVAADATAEGNDQQNPNGLYSNYVYNTYSHRGRHNDDTGVLIKEHNGVATATNDDGQSYVDYAIVRTVTYTRTGTNPNYEYNRIVKEQCYEGTDNADDKFYDSSKECYSLYNNQTQRREYYGLSSVVVEDRVVKSINGTAVTDPTLYTVRYPYTSVDYNYQGIDADGLTWTGNECEVDKDILEYIPREGKSIYLPIDYVADVANGPTTYAPMKSTRIIIPAGTPNAPVLTKANVRGGYAHADGNDILDLATSTTPNIEYDMPVRTPDNPNDPEAIYTVEPYYENTVAEVHFKAGARMMGTEYLNYDKAWVDYELDVNRWYTLASPLQDTYSGEWYAPTGIDADNSAKQLTPYFYDITYSAEMNDRFRPAIYQRSWDKYNDKANVYLKDGGEAYAYLTGDWSYVYNDVLQKYGTGGFSVKVSDEHMTFKPSNGKSIIRMPKADAEYTYYDMDKQEGQKADDALPEVSHRYRLWTDAMTAPAPDQDLELQQTITNAVATNNYFLVGNPFMANLDMEKFFEANADQLEKVYWVVSAEDGQTVSVRSAYDQKNNSTVDDDQRWVVTDSEGKFGADYAVVAPLQGFFVKAKNSVNSVTLKYTAGMQTLKITTLSMLRQPEHPSPIDPESEAADTDESIDEGPTYTIEGKRIPVSAFGKGVVISRGKKVLRN